MSVSALGLGGDGTPAPHWLHGDERIWTEVNCYADLWIEVVHALGDDPVAGLAYTLSARFDGDQWTFIKPYPQDLERLYGLDVHEINTWRPVLEHVVEHLSRGDLVTVEVDSWYLPDTAGVSYQREHVKTTIIPERVEAVGRRLGYFHGAGYHELAGDDFDGVFGLRNEPGGDRLPPYVELVRRRVRRPDEAPPERELVERALGTAREHLHRRSGGNPVREMGQRMVADLDWLRSAGLDAFHRYAFATCRQCGATAELAADFCRWLAERGHPGMLAAVAPFCAVAEGAKALQFTLARAARGRSVDLSGLLEGLADQWDAALAVVERELVGR